VAETPHERVLVLAPVGRDARAAAQQLTQAGLACVVCSDLKDLAARLDEGAGVALIAEEAFLSDSTEQLNRWVAKQAAWSDFPFIVLTSHHTSAYELAHRLRLLENLGNVSLMERPLAPVTLVSAVKSALRARARQYEVRDHLAEREQTASSLERLVEERTRQLLDTNRQLQAEIAERKQVQSALQQAQKMEMIGQMTGGIAHDFNNLLTAVIGNLDLAARRVSDEKVRRLLSSASQAAERGAKLVAQLLAFSRKQHLQPQPIDLNRLVSGMGDLLFRTIGGTIRIETVLQNDLWPAMADASQVELIILNLALNARDAMPGGGRLTISTANSTADAPTRPLDLAGEYVLVSVSDSGSGMTDDVVAKAFEPFFTTKPVGSGTGLGLSQVYGITTQLGGRIQISTQLGKGTTVSVYLPRAHRTTVERPKDRAAATVQSSPQHATVLVVDDDEDVRKLAVACLEDLGYTVLSAAGGQEALEIIGGPAQIDLLLIDIAMPEINGTEVARAALAKRPQLPILFMTGFVEAAQARTAEHEILAKPFTVAQLAEKLVKTMSGRKAGRPHPPNVVALKTGPRG
jgi:signal transduction histidine kinase/CheY-like chemotaxis protein